MEAKKRILLVEHNLFIGGILVERMKSQNFDVIMVSDGKEGMFQMLSLQPDLTILDIEKDELMTFFSVLNSVKRSKKLKHPHMMVLADAVEQEEIKKITSLDATAFILKAFSSIDEIVQKVKMVVEAQHPLGIVAGVVPEAERQSPLPKNNAESSIQEPLVSAQKKLRAEIEKLIVLPNEELAIVGLVDNLVEYAFWARASDIHIKPEEQRVLVRLRIDGSLHDSFIFPKNIQQ